MRNFISILFILTLSLSCSPVTTIYLVRHAEKIDNSKDPDLSAIGIARADRLAKLLQSDHIMQIFSTDYKRTKQTALPLSLLNHINIQLYTPDSLASFASLIKKQKLNTLVVSHSNTTISLLDAMGLQHKLKVIADNDYSNLFKIRIKNSKMKLEELKY